MYLLIARTVNIVKQFDKLKFIFYTLIMIKKTCIILAGILFLGLSSYAQLDIVYPSNQNITLNSPTVYFSGNTDKNASLTINSEKVKLWDGGIFVQVVPLKYGNNKILIKSSYNGKTEEKIYNVKRNKTSDSYKPKMAEYIKNETGVLYTKTINSNSTVRDKASSSSKRVAELPKGVVLYLEGRQGDYYKINETGNSEFWIHKSNIQEPVVLSNKIIPYIKDQKYYYDNNYEYRKFYLTHPVLYTLTQQGNKIILTMYGVHNKGNSDENYVYTFDFSSPILGYECYYEENNLIFKRAILPKDTDENSILKGINIFVDAGHGGNDKGTIGPGRMFEKDVNLDIANNLIKLLKEEGANVSFSRNNDTQVGLYKRVDMAKENKALISVSIHSNSLPYGSNPYINHGNEVHYYNDNSKELAQILNNNLSNDLNIKCNGIHKSSFALTRSTNPVSVLVETAYMIYPEEYLLLKNPIFRKNAAKSIKNSIKEFLIAQKRKEI